MTNFNRSPREPQCRRRASRSAPRTLAWLLVLLIAATVFAAAQACAAEHLRIAAQKTGTLAWELDIIRAAGLDRQHDLAIETTELASTEAGKIALKGGSADLIVTDWLWVGRERALGDNLVFYPYSSALGAVMAPANSNIKGIADLVGKKIGVAGGPLDKSWLLLRALARRSGVDLKTQAQIAYGAPPLLTQKALQGETDATLTFWNFCAELEGKGMSRVVAMEDVVKQLGAKGSRGDGRLRIRRRLGATQPRAARSFLCRHAAGEKDSRRVAGRMAAAGAAHRGRRRRCARNLSSAISRGNSAPAARR